MKKKIVIGSAAVLLLAIVGYVLHLVQMAGEFKDITPHFDGQCKHVKGVIGAEDMERVPNTSLILISSEDRLAGVQGNPKRGAIYLYDLETDAPPIDITPSVPERFHPHGVGIFATDDETRLFVVSHPLSTLKGDLDADGPKHTVEIFRFKDRKLEHIETVSHPEFLNTPNDVAPVGPTQFYATNDHGSGDRTMRQIEDYLRLGLSNIVYYDGKSFRRFDPRYEYANGIVASGDYSEIYMAAPSEQAAFIFKRQPDDSLDLMNKVDIGTGPDNITVDEAGDLWIGAHPKLLTLVGHLKDPTKIAPSQVIRINRSSRAFDEVMMHDGTEIPGSSVALHHKGRLLVGTVMGDGFYDCRIR